MSAISEQFEAYRSLRAEIEAAVLPLARSVDGRRFDFQAAVDGLELSLGGYVVLEGEDADALGQVRSLQLAEVDAGDVGLTPPQLDDVSVRAKLPIRMARGQGVLLDGAGAPFNDRPARPATPDEVNAWLARASSTRARLAVGTLALARDVPMSLDAGGFDRHTFMCGQSGSGKSYSLGLMLEQLLLETDLRIVVLDPNSDCVRLPETREGVVPDLAARWQDVATRIAVCSAQSPGDRRLRLRFGKLESAAQGALLRLDPIADREEYAELAAIVEEHRPESLAGVGDEDRPEARRLRLRVRNLGVQEWGVWARTDPGSVFDLLDDEALRMVVVDVGSLATRDEQALVAESVLGHLWERRARRRPVLVVIDEAHNVCPRVPGDALTQLATEHAIRIAGEGRKFGIYMLVASQRPAKVHENVLSQCDNLILMRLNSSADAELISELYGFVPPALVGLSTDFRLGEALVAGKIATHPTIARFGARVASEGGSDVDAGWAAAR